MDTEPATPQRPEKTGFSGLQVLGIVLAAVVVTALITGVVVWRYVFPSDFQPVELSNRELANLDEKLEVIGIHTDGVPVATEDYDAQGRVVPEAYSEKGASREVSFTERELNGLLANNTNLARRLAIDLSDNLASAKLLVPMDPDFPILGGKTLRVNAGLEIAFREARPVAVLKGVSVMGVPLPNAWLGNLKNVDLVSEFGGNPGLWQSLAAGIEYIEIRDSRLLVKLKE